jgi:anti-sigma-K factor RskA
MSERFDALDVALGELEPDQREAAEARMRSDPAFRAEVERLRATVERLDAQPAHTWDPPAAPPLPALPERGRRSAPRRRLAIAVAAAALIGVGVAGTLAVDELTRDEPSGRRVALDALSLAPGASGSADLGSGVRLTVSGLRPSRPGEYYELWLLNSAEDLVSVGTFRVGEQGSATVEFPLGVDPSGYRLVDVSVEPDDGNPAHSTRSVLRSG